MVHSSDTSFSASQGDEPAIKRNEQRLAALRELSRNIAPLKLRRSNPTTPMKAVTLCDWDDENVRSRHILQ